MKKPTKDFYTKFSEVVEDDEDAADVRHGAMRIYPDPYEEGCETLFSIGLQTYHDDLDMTLNASSLKALRDWLIEYLEVDDMPSTQSNALNERRKHEQGHGMQRLRIG